MIHLKKPFTLIIYGPTAVGKTDLAINIAHTVPAEIVNMDTGQFYTPLSIGTAKPDWKKANVPHHLFDIVDEPKNITVTQYRTLLFDTLHDIWQRGKLPILVGGSGFYLKSVLFPISNNEHKSAHVQLSKIDNLWDQLRAIDPQRAEQIHKNDMYRIKRALEIWHTTGKKPSEQTVSYEPPSDYMLIVCSREREELYKKINQRVFEMLDAGWIAEAAPLQSTEWEVFLKTKKIIGYEEIFHYLASAKTKLDYESLVETLQQRTRNYAKRQITFWRSLEKKINDVQHKNKEKKSEIALLNLTLCDVDLYIKQLSQQLLKMFDKK